MIYRSDQFIILVHIAGILTDDTLWDSFDGGDTAGNSVQYQPAGVGGAVSLGGVPRRNAITLQRAWSDIIAPKYKLIDQATGAAAVAISVTTKGADGKGIAGTTDSYSGVLDGVSRPGYEKTGGREALLQIVVDPNMAIA